MAKNQYISDIKRKRTQRNAVITVICFIGLLGMSYTVASVDENKPVQRKSDCEDCHNTKVLHSEMTEYFRPTSKMPEKMATAVLATKTPRLMAAIAKVETGGNPQIRKAGYKKRHDGAFQVNAKYWGKVSSDPVKQAKQAEGILSELVGDYPLKKALSIYGGDSSNKYQQTVLAELERVP